MSVSFSLRHPVSVNAFKICRGLCVCTEMSWMCVLYVSFGCKVRPRSIGCVAMRSAVLFILGPDCSYSLPCILLLNVMDVFSVGGVLCWIDRVWSSKECTCCACDLNVHLTVPSIGFVCVFVCRKLSPHLRVCGLDYRCLLSLCCFFV